MAEQFENPFRPGAGHLPPHLAGREKEIEYFKKSIINQKPILKNLVISGLRGVGKTVLMDTLKPIAIKQGWIWAGTDFGESVNISEQNLSIRIIADLASAVSGIKISETQVQEIGFAKYQTSIPNYLTFELLYHVYNSTPGLETDKLKGVIEFTWSNMQGNARGIILAYDEAQNLKGKAKAKEFPLSILLETIQYIQRKELPILLVLTGLPTLYPNLVEARTYAERMFHLLTIDKLEPSEAKEAITVPIEKQNCPVVLVDAAVDRIVEASGGYPYFIQYLCKETFDSYLQQKAMGKDSPVVILEDVLRKLDSDFYHGRWHRLTDKQRELLVIISKMGNPDVEFTLKEIEESSVTFGIPLTKNAVIQMLKALTECGLVYKNKHGRYSFAVPMFSQFVRRESLYPIK